MRVFVLLLAIVLMAGAWAKGQTPPSANDLPTVVKPKPAPGNSVPSTAPNAAPGTMPDANPVAAPKEAVPETEEQQKTEPKGKPEIPAPLEEANQLGEDPTKAKEDVAGEAVAGDTPSLNAGPDYTGPSILSRGTNFVRSGIPADERFRPFLGANFYHQLGVGGYQGPDVKTDTQAFTGGDITLGLSGRHSRRADTFELDYRGHIFLNGLSGQDHSLSFEYGRVLARRLTVIVGENAGLYANNFSGLSSVSTADPSVSNSGLVVTPSTEAFSNRTYFSTTQGDVIYQKSARLSFKFGTAFFNVNRDSKLLAGTTGYQGRTDVSYRITKRMTVGSYYAYNRYYFSRTFGDSDLNTVGLSYSIGISKRTEVRFRAGGTRLESRGLQVVRLDPAVAEILGVASGLRRFYNVSYVPDFGALLTRGFQHGDLSISYVKGVSPGNGIILTSRRESESVTYAYTGIRRYAVTFGVGRDGLVSASQLRGSYSGYYGRLGISRSLPHDIQGLLAFDYRKVGITNNSLNSPDQFRISVGFAFAPGYGPLRFW